MFTGIVETMGRVVSVTADRGNLDIEIESPISGELKPDQSVSHNGICLTVTWNDQQRHRVTAVQETILRTEIVSWKPGMQVNLERCLKADGRFDGHIVQGHVDCTAVLDQRKDENGSTGLWFSYPASAGITVAKGSICINGVSLTVVESGDGFFSVVIIPYTLGHTNLGGLNAGDSVNLEFDILGKYIHKIMHNSGA